MPIDPPHYNRYIGYFLIVTALLPSIYFSFNGIYLSEPVVTLMIIFVGYLSFITGYKIRLGFKPAWIDRQSILPNRLSFSRQAAITLILVVISFSIFAPFRFNHNIGVPDFPPSIAYAGFIFYLTTYGVQALIISAFMVSEKKTINFLILIFGVFSYAIYEASLGWRIGMLQGIIILAVCSAYLDSGNQLSGRKKGANHALNRGFRLLLMFLMIFAITFLVIKLQSGVRDPGAGFSLAKVFLRFWGANYLDQTVTFFIARDYGIFTNGSHFYDLLNSGVSGAEFNNTVIHGNALGQHHGNSKTGFGSIYIYSGLLGVMIVFFLTGRYFRVVYNLSAKRSSLFFTTAAILHFALLFRIVNEQYDLGTVKTVVAIWVCSLIGSSLISFICRLTFPLKIR